MNKKIVLLLLFAGFISFNIFAETSVIKLKEEPIITFKEDSVDVEFILAVPKTNKNMLRRVEVFLETKDYYRQIANIEFFGKKRDRQNNRKFNKEGRKERKSQRIAKMKGKMDYLPVAKTVQRIAWMDEKLIIMGSQHHSPGEGQLFNHLPDQVYEPVFNTNGNE